MSTDLPESLDLLRLTIFVSSPGDVAEERLIAKRVLDRLAAEFAPRRGSNRSSGNTSPCWPAAIFKRRSSGRQRRISWSAFSGRGWARDCRSNSHVLTARRTTPARNSSSKTPWKGAGNAACPICWCTARRPSRW